MADEVEKKPQAILNKKKNSIPAPVPSQPASPAGSEQAKTEVRKQNSQGGQEKRKVVVVKKKPNPASQPAKQDAPSSPEQSE